MQIVLANPRGFCAGVRMAIDVVDQVLDIVGDDETKALCGVEPFHTAPHNSAAVFILHHSLRP